MQYEFFQFNKCNNNSGINAGHYIGTVENIFNVYYIKFQNRYDSNRKQEV